MSAQLASAPQAVYRQEAVLATECALPDDLPTLYGQRNHTNEKSLFCSNYKVWQRALSSDADYVVTLEDDAVLAPGFWDNITHLMSSCANFDYVTVDSWKGGGNPAPDRTDMCDKAGITSLYRPNPKKYLDYWGTQVQIIRRPYLETLIARAQAHGMGPMDVWWMMRVNDGRSFSWQPHIAHQAQHADSITWHEACSASIVKSDIEPSLFQKNKVPRLMCD